MPLKRVEHDTGLRAERATLCREQTFFEGEKEKTGKNPPDSEYFQGFWGDRNTANFDEQRLSASAVHR